MELIKLIVVCILTFSITCSAHRRRPMMQPEILETTNPGEPLFLTPYIESGRIEEAQQAAKVPPFFGNIISYAGFLTINKQFNSNLYFWFYPAEINPDKAPLLIWLQGGPGVSSIYTVFDQYGPYILNKDNKLMSREIYWSKIFNVIYMENPVGTGFSFTENDKGYSKTENEIGQNLYNAMKQFYQLFPQYKKNDFYIIGSSYAGKFIPALGYAIYENEKNLKESEKINLKGLIIGSGFCDPKTVMYRSDILYQTGLIDFNYKQKLELHIEKIVSLIDEQKFIEALDYNSNVMRKELFEKIGFDNLFNYRYNKFFYPFGDHDKFINSNSTRRKIHVGNISFNTNEKVGLYLRNDIMQSVKPWLETLIENYRIMMYVGQLDLEIPYTAIETLLQQLNWSGAENYKTAERRHWNVDEELAGYIKVAGRLTDVLIRNAGHMPGLDQPKFMLDLIKFFTNGTSTVC